MDRLTPLIIFESRKHGLLPNERTTVLTRADELQILQYHIGMELATQEVCPILNKIINRQRKDTYLWY